MENLTTFIARADTGMLLVETMTTPSSWRRQAKVLLRNFSESYPDTPSRRTLQHGDHLFHYIIESNVVYMAICDASYPKGLTFQFLEDLSRRFLRENGGRVSAYDRPYAAQAAFDMTLNKLRREYEDPNSSENLSRMERDIHSIHGIMVSNIQEVLKRGEKLEKMSSLSQDLVSGSKQFQRRAKYLNFQIWLKKVGFYAGAAVFVLGVLYWRFF